MASISYEKYGQYHERFEKVQETISQSDRSGLPNIGKTAFLSTSRQELFDAVLELIDDDIIDTTKTFIDLGSGAGDVTTVVAYVFGIPTVGIEFDDELITYARQINDRLKEELGSVDLCYIQADFTETSIYDNIDIGTLYNFISGDIEEVLQLAPKGTIFMSYLAGGETKALRMKHDKIWKQVKISPIFDDLNEDRRSELENEVENLYHGWYHLKTIPASNMHVYKRQ